jgi:transposase
MSKRFRACDLNQPFLLPPSLQDWLPEGHLARFVGEIVDGLDLSAIYATYQRKDGRGLAAYHPLLMVRLLLYGYCVGVASSRQIERRTHEDVAFRYLAADQHPDHDTIASFRQTHLSDLAGLFLQALQLCEKAGLVKLGHVAIDGTKLQANASKHKAMSYERMTEKEQALKEEVEQLLAEAARVDAAEDAQYGKGKRGDELPAELARRESRLQKIAQAKAALEQEARERVVAEPSVAQAMRQKLSSPEGQAVYKMRKAVVEPVFGQIKERWGFRRFLFRGLKKVQAEWQIICLTHNLLKLFQAAVCPPALGTA